MKVLMLSYEFPPVGGGGARVVHGLSSELVRSGHQVDVITMGFGGLPPREDVEGIGVHRVRCLRRRRDHCTVPEAASYFPGAVRLARRLLARTRYDVLHAHFILPDGLIAWLASRMGTRPFLITAHGSDVPGYNPHRLKLAHALMASVWRRVVRDAARVVCPSQSLQALVLQRTRQARLTWIPNGIGADRFRADGKKAPRILAVTRMVERKGIQYLLEALKAPGLDFEVDLVGDGPYLPALRQAAEGLSGRVRFWGWLENRSPEFQRLFEGASIFVLPSEAENFPIVLLEAMSAGLAIITTSGTGCAEVVGNTGILVEPRNAAMLREALVALHRDPARCRALGQAARKRLEEHFSWSAIAERYREVYASLVAGASGL